MAKKSDINEGVKLKTSNGRIGVAYAVTKKKLNEGIVDLFFEGPGSVIDDCLPPCGMYNIKYLELVK